MKIRITQTRTSHSEFAASFSGADVTQLLLEALRARGMVLPEEVTVEMYMEHSDGWGWASVAADPFRVQWIEGGNEEVLEADMVLGDPPTPKGAP